MKYSQVQIDSLRLQYIIYCVL